MSSSHPVKVLVFGASGYIGSYLVPELLKHPFNIRASSRNKALLAARQWQGVELVQADALDPESLLKAMAGVDLAYYLVHSMGEGKNFAKTDLRAAENFAKAAEKSGLKHIIYLGGLVPENAKSEHINSRRETGERLRSAGSVPVTELRAGIVVGPGSAAFEVMRDLVFHLPLMITPKWVRSFSPPIALENLLSYLVQLALRKEAYNKIFDAAGPESLNYQQMMNSLAEVAGRRKPLILPVPFLSPKLSSYWLKYVSSVPTNIARALIDGLKHDFFADDQSLRELVPQALYDFRSSVERVFSMEQQHAVQSRWVEGAFRIRKQRIDYAYYAKKAGGSAIANARPEQVWQVLSTIGGTQRYFYLNGLWTLRETLDWLIGGPGLNRQRRHPAELRLGDKVDSWTVIGLEPYKRLTLAFGMRAPGAGVLEFELSERDKSQCEITAKAYWHPAGAPGLLYWYSLELAHLVIFKGMTEAIARQAEGIAGAENN
ncbi:Uncharacterized conserved protein YbjT, contains NAD(P)-binding and DUF2867 domains [Alteromonadaceae bacterium Bs31]|nr:Uncharacterized conserved protein YbjT, contains NAD(P)-binding and DUF2867 domains [Alteromonadaceae bacterium Bs31]